MSKFNWEPAKSLKECEAIMTAPGELHELETAIIDGAVYRVYKNLWPSLRQFWLATVSKNTAVHAQEYIVFEDFRMTYGEADQLVQRAASVFREVYGVRKGDRVGIAMRNLPEWIISFFAVSMLGAVPAKFNSWLPEQPFLRCIELTAPKLLIVDPERLNILSTHLDKLKLHVLVVGNTGPSLAGSCKVKDWATTLSGYAGSLEAWEQEPDVYPDDDGTIFFTSGTTGFNKAVLMTQRGFLGTFFGNTFALRRWALRLGQDLPPPLGRGPAPPTPPEQGVMFIAMPLFHATACSQLVSTTATGAKLVLIRKWDKEKAAALMIKEKVSVFVGVPSLVYDLIESGLVADKNSLQMMALAGAPVADTMVGEMRRKFPGLIPQQGYGSSETSLAIGIMGEDFMARPGSTGLPLGVVDILIVDPHTEKVLPSDQVGELWIRGPNIMRGYLNNPKANAEAFTRDGWFKTGDLASIDKEGFVYIKDRLKDMIIRGGENIHSAIVENAFFADERVMECAVVGIPDKRLGELVGAAIVPRKDWLGKLDANDLLEKVRPRLPAYAVPAMILIQDVPLERNAAGKVLKPELRKALAQEWTQRELVKGKL